MGNDEMSQYEKGIDCPLKMSSIYTKVTSGEHQKHFCSKACFPEHSTFRIRKLAETEKTQTRTETSIHIKIAHSRSAPLSFHSPNIVTNMRKKEYGIP